MSKTKLPTLYKRDSKGRIQIWEIFVTGNQILTRHGLEDGKQQEDSETITEGKNPGKSNATTPEQQAGSEAQSRWNRKKERKGYSTDREGASKGETQQAGHVSPMLAKRMDECAKRVKWPAFAQPKLDGLRGLVHVEDGVCTFFSRQRKQIGIHLTKLAAEFERLFPTGTWEFDGEAFSREIPFNHIQSAVMDRGEEPNEHADDVQMWVYDLPTHPGGFAKRSMILTDQLLGRSEQIVVVETVLCQNEEDWKRFYEKCLSEGYEGAMYRTPGGLYEQGKRSYGLLKMKVLYETDRRNEEDFQIVSVHSGRGKFQGLAVFTCRTKNGVEFDCAAPGTHEEKAAAMHLPFNGGSLQDYLLEVTFAEITPDGRPRFPVATKIKQKNT